MFDPIDGIQVISDELIDSWRDRLKKHVEGCMTCRYQRPEFSLFHLQKCRVADTPFKMGRPAIGLAYTNITFDMSKSEDDKRILLINRNRDGKISFWSWQKNGVLHREDGPARMEYDDDGKLKVSFHLVDTIRIIPFWEFYERATEENKNILLRDWLHIAG